MFETFTYQNIFLKTILSHLSNILKCSEYISWVILKENIGHSPSINIPQEVKFITFSVPYIFMMVKKLVMLMKSTVLFFSQINTILSRQSPPTSPVKMGSNDV